MHRKYFPTRCQRVVLKDNPFTNTLVVKGLLQTKDLKNDSDAVNKAILRNEEKTDDKFESE